MFKYLIIIFIIFNNSYAMFDDEFKNSHELNDIQYRILVNKKEKYDECELFISYIDRELKREGSTSDRAIKVFNEIKQDLIAQKICWKKANTLEDPLLINIDAENLLSKGITYGYFIEELDYLNIDLIFSSTTSTSLAFYYGKKLNEIILRLKPFYGRNQN